MKILSDYHVHSSFSGDSSVSPEAVIEQAISHGLQHLCLTDHMDYDYTDGDVCFEFDPREYFRRLQPLKEKYRDQIDLCIGVELGLRPYLSGRHHSLIFSYPFDFVIGSIHLVNNRDPYFPSYFEGRDESDAYLEYFQCALYNLRAYSIFDTFGHLDYVVRYGQNPEVYSYRKYSDEIDAVLKLLLEKGIALEVNTAGFRTLGRTNPEPDVLRRYRELGGELITVGSDGHQPEYLGYRFRETEELLRSCGFSYYAVFRQRKPEFIKI